MDRSPAPPSSGPPSTSPSAAAAETTRPRATSPPEWPVHAVLVAVQLSFAGFHVIAKALLGGTFDSLTLAGMRVGLATPLLMFLAWRTDRHLPTWRELPHLALLGLLGVFANQLLFLTGLRWTTATNASILILSIPAFTAGLGALFGVERIGRRTVGGIALAALGALVLLDPTSFSFTDGSTLGNLLVVANCLSYSAFLVAQRPVLARLPWRTVIAGAFFFGSLGLVPLSLPGIAALEPAILPASAWWGLAYVVLVPTVFAYSMNTWAVSRAGPALAATYTTLQPLMTSLLAALFLGERAGGAEALGFVFIAAGLALVSLRRRRAAARGSDD